jgi:hypothetical protein
LEAPLPKLLRNVIAPILAVLLILVSLQILSAEKALKAKEEILSACLERGMDFTWSSQSHGLITEVEIECVRQ